MHSMVESLGTAQARQPQQDPTSKTKRTTCHVRWLRCQRLEMWAFSRTKQPTGWSLDASCPSPKKDHHHPKISPLTDGTTVFARFVGYGLKSWTEKAQTRSDVSAWGTSWNCDMLWTFEVKQLWKIWKVSHSFSWSHPPNMKYHQTAPRRNAFDLLIHELGSHIAGISHVRCAP